MNTDTIKKWMKDNGISIHKLAKYIGVTPCYFTGVLNGREAMSKKLQAKVKDAMSLEDVSPIKDMAYLKIPFTREEWKRLHAVWSDLEELQTLTHDSIMGVVQEIDKLKSKELCLAKN